MQTDTLASLGIVATRHSVEPADFRRGMRSLAGAVCLIATGAKGERVGLTATAVCSITADPPRILVCINKSTGTHALVLSNGQLSVNVLYADQVGLAKRFAGFEPGVTGDEKFIDSLWDELDDTPMLNGAAASFLCRVTERNEQSTHTMFLCDVVEARSACGVESRGGPLLYVGRHFRHLSPMRGSEQSLIDWSW